MAVASVADDEFDIDDSETGLSRDEGTRFVTRAKYAISFFNIGQGRVPFLPMPFLTVAATMSVNGGVDAVVDIFMI